MVPVHRDETDRETAEISLSRLPNEWFAAGRFDWVIALGIIAITLPTGLFLYDKFPGDKAPALWLAISATTVVIPLLVMKGVGYWRQHGVSVKIVETIIANGYIPARIFAGLMESDKRVLQSEILLAIPMVPGESISISELVDKQTLPREKGLISQYATVIWDLFEGLGLVEIRNGRIAAVSEHAAALLHCIALGLRENTTLLTNWRVKNVADPAFRRAFDFISQAEENRRAMTREAVWVPVRKDVKVSLVLIKAIRNGVEEVLVHWSASWTNYNWVGGTQEPADRDPEACAWREMHEELGVDRSGILSLGSLGSITCSPIKSVRLGVYSTWQYSVFVLNARSIGRRGLPIELERILPPTAEFEVFTDQLRMTKVRWEKWRDIAEQPNFGEYGAELTQFLLARFGNVAPTFSFDLADS
jgi:8-oxo-dGTP pyrophosphatase MutT (NUDIX family)